MSSSIFIDVAPITAAIKQYEQAELALQSAIARAFPPNLPVCVTLFNGDRNVPLTGVIHWPTTPVSRSVWRQEVQVRLDVNGVVIGVPLAILIDAPAIVRRDAVVQGASDA